MKNKKTIIIAILLMILLVFIGVFIYKNWLKNKLFTVNSDGSYTLLDKYTPTYYNYDYIYVEIQKTDHQYKAIYAFENNAVINCKLVFEYSDPSKAKEAYEKSASFNKYNATYDNNTKYSYNTVSYNGMSKEQILTLFDYPETLEDTKLLKLEIF